MTIEQKKYNIIQRVIAADQSELIDAIDQLIDSFSSVSGLIKFSFDKHPHLSKPVDINQIKKERAVTHLNMTEFVVDANKLTWNQSVEELMEDLK